MQKFGIYVHIPFCQKKCKYCDFVSFDKCDKSIKERYVDALLKEIENCEIDKKITTIYFGGGTPSLLPAEAIERILEKIYEKFDVHKKAEITIEINPGTVDLPKLEKYKKMGINRLSIGLQATQYNHLKLLGRIHDFGDFGEAYIGARRLGFENINVDLILGIPNQTLREFELSLKELVIMNPDHISIYSLIVEEDTELEKMIKNNEIEMISEDLERQMYWKAKEILGRAHYEHYEISNFARKGFESKHNLSCWNQDEYIGFGLAAHSYKDKKRFSNTSDLGDYLKNIENGEFSKNIEIQENEQTFEEQAKEYMMLGLRKINGISISEFEQKFQINPLFYFRFEISKLEDEGLAEVDLDNIKLTEKGLDFANIVFEQFV